MGWIACVRCQKFGCEFMARTFALIAPVQPISHRVSCNNETIQNAPKHYKNALIHEFSVQWGGSDAFIVKNIAPVHPILHRVPCSNETLPNAPKHYEMLQNMSLVPMGWIECVLCEKFRCDFMAQTCALIAPVQPVLHRVSCSNETLTNAPKHYENAPKHEFGSDGVDRVRSLPKIPMRVGGTDFCINCSSSAYFTPSFMQ